MYKRQEYDPKTQTVNVQVYAYPIKLEEQTGAQFYAVCSGEKITVPAVQVESGFEATLPIPVSEETDYFSADMYLIWTQDGQTLTEKVCSISRYMDEIRPRIDTVSYTHLAGLRRRQWVGSDHPGPQPVLAR